MKQLLLILLSIFILTTTTLAIEGPLITFRFDDSGVPTFRYARPILKAYGYVGVYFQPVYKINTEGSIKWWQLKTLYNEGWEIGAHGYDLHCDYRKLPLDEVDRQMRLAKEAYQRKGFKVVSYASPQGYYNEDVLSVVKQYFSIHAGTRPYGLNTYPWSRWESVCGGEKAVTNPFRKAPTVIHSDTPLNVVLDWIDQAKSENSWLILHIHTLVKGEPTAWAQVNIDYFKTIVEYVYNSNIPVVTYSEALVGEP